MGFEGVRRRGGRVTACLLAAAGAACADPAAPPADEPPPPEPAAPTRPALVADDRPQGPTRHEDDLQIRYVQRLPRIDYVPGARDPSREGWPAVGTEVTWVAHLANTAAVERPDVGYRWRLDGEAVAEGTVDLPADGEAEVAFAWTWTFQRHTLEIEIDPDDRYAEEARNNRRALHTDAISAAFYVEEGFHAYFGEHQHELGVGSNSFEDWAARQVRMWNDLLAKARYPSSPDGVLDRVRLDRVMVVPDGALPLDPGTFGPADFDPAQARPDVGDRSVDLQWGFPTAMLDAGVYDDHTSVLLSNQFYYSGFLQHELGHARYLVDVYAWNVHAGADGDRLEILEDGTPVAGSARMPGTAIVANGERGVRVHGTPYEGLMNFPWTFMDAYSAAAWNLIAGRRATAGNYNAPDNLGSFLNDLPARNLVTLVGRGARRRLSGARVSLFRGSVPSARQEHPSPYRHLFDDQVDEELVADARGVIDLGRNPFGGDRPVEVGAFTNGVVILRVESDGRVGYAFLESTDFNLAYWSGSRDVAEHALYVDLR